MKYLTYLFTLSALIWSNNLFAYDIAVANEDGVTIYYNYINDGTELEVSLNTGYKYKGIVNIPETVIFMNRIRKVTSIEDYCFSGSDITEVTIPNSITKIGKGAFQYCGNLKTVSIPSCYIGYEAFYKAGVTSVFLGDDVQTIGGRAFSYCESLTTISFGKGLINVGKEAFIKSKSIRKVIINDISSWCNVNFETSSGFESSTCNPLFYSNCIYSDENTLITDLVIPEGVTHIAECAFGDNGLILTSVQMPTTLTSIANGNFSLFRKEMIVIVKDIAAWCNMDMHVSTMYSDGGLYRLYCDANTEIKELVIPDGVKEINYGVFGRTTINSVSIPNSVTSIEGSAFQDCI